MKVTAEDFIQNYSRLADGALTEPLTIVENGEDRLVVLSAAEFGRLKRARTAIVRPLTEDEVALVARAEVPAEYAFLDEELKDVS
ncbi:type II toxin-antitoxin system Phd/YefM family antitoxin [Beijerinckia sp. L45]|uniref:type II toxin-antitoxin system Phd/YefM family antitoxin n=1 Tax=Beijerinckia sp. L45 TaxID=1641855 RepID=UPI00131DC4FB|nr:type II toxin-antitoxin system Phd/YefM family antitoxin [Beijerinckia sp. L45]